MCRSVLKCVAVCCSVFSRLCDYPHDVTCVLQCVAVCCSIMQCIELNFSEQQGVAM